jgi:hypothetical protein
MRNREERRKTASMRGRDPQALGPDYWRGYNDAQSDALLALNQVWLDFRHNDKEEGTT